MWSIIRHTSLYTHANCDIIYVCCGLTCNSDLDFVINIVCALYDAPRLGFSHSSGNLLLDPALNEVVDPAKHNSFDWAHCYMVNGLFNTQVGLMMSELKASKVTYSVLYEYVQLWSWPRRLSGRSATGHEAMGPKRATGSNKAGKFNAAASEGLSLFPVLAHWIRSVLLPSGAHAAACKAFLSLSEVLDLLLASARGGVSPKALETAIVQHMDDFKSAFGEENVAPKGHYVLHLPEMLHRLGFLPNTLVHERKHKTVKRFGDAVSNTGAGFDRGILEEVTCHALHAMATAPGLKLELGLQEPKNPPNTLCRTLEVVFGFNPRCTYSQTCRFSKWGTCCVGDAVFWKEDGHWRVGQVLWHINVVSACTSQVDDATLTGLTAWELRRWTAASSTWLAQANTTLIRSLAICDTCIWSLDEHAGVATVLHPIGVR